MKILVSALEPSGNLHLKSILENDVSKKLVISGIFDPELGKAQFSSNQFNVMGIFSIIPKILKAKKIMSKLVEMVEGVDKVLLIDSPAFNIPFAKKIKKKYPEKQIIYYILPKIWAWKENRKEKIEKYIDIQISIFPFEKTYYPNSKYFGNPLLEEIQDYKNSLTKSNKVSFLAGSRKSEIKNLMPIFRKVVKKLDEKAILVIPPHIKNLSIYGDISSFEISRDTKNSLLNSSFAFICSGTATLESALIGTPFALIYKTNKVEFFIGKQFVKLKYVGLANIIFEKLGLEEVFHKEFLQNINIDQLIQEKKSIDSIKFLKNSKKLREILKGDSHKEILNLILQD